MIIVKLIGGLGNQMFQYAAGKALALRHHTEVKVDTIELESDPEGKFTKRHFELGIFESKITIASKEEVNAFSNLGGSKIKREFQRRFPFLFSRLMAVESGTPYHPEFTKYPKHTYLSGFWQSELYFKDVAQDIKKDFTFGAKIIDRNKELATKILGVNSVSVHVRRGDYVSNANAHQFHGLCSLDYYNQAVSMIAEKQGAIELFVFSDDIAWCKENLKYDFPIYFVETNDAHSDMYLMTLCKHNIIANSSFSWWGAWLNNHSQKIVVAPKQWIVDPSVNTKDIIPQSWIKL
jgi:hypothetical protein